MAKLQFPPDKVRADTEAEANIAQIVDEVAATPDGRFLLTKNGDPSVVIVNVDYIENLLGDKVVGSPPPGLPYDPAMPTSPPPMSQPGPPPSVGDFMAQPQPPQEVQEKPPLEPPTATDFRPLLNPLDAGQPAPPTGPGPAQPPSQPMPPSSPAPSSAATNCRSRSCPPGRAPSAARAGAATQAPGSSPARR